MKKKLLLIVNPVAGKMQGKAALFPLCDGFCRKGYAVTVFVTAARGDAERVTTESAERYDLVVCCGGDGTLCEVINGLLCCKKQVPLGYVPLGSTNDFATSLGLPRRYPQAVEAITDGGEMKLDVGCFGGDRYFSYIASFGAFTAASYKAPQSSKNALGHFAYVLEGVKELAAIQPYTVRLETEERTIEGQFLFGAVCNSTSVGGLLRLDPSQVDMSDGLFEIMLVRPPKNASDFGKLITSVNSGVFDKKLFEFFKTAKATFTVDGDPSWSLDGEMAEVRGSVTVENRPGAILFRK